MQSSPDDICTEISWGLPLLTLIWLLVLLNGCEDTNDLSIKPVPQILASPEVKILLLLLISVDNIQLLWSNLVAHCLVSTYL